MREDRKHDLLDTSHLSCVIISGVCPLSNVNSASTILDSRRDVCRTLRDVDDCADENNLRAVTRREEAAKAASDSGTKPKSCNEEPYMI